MVLNGRAPAGSAGGRGGGIDDDNEEAREAGAGAEDDCDDANDEAKGACMPPEVAVVVAVAIVDESKGRESGLNNLNGDFGDRRGMLNDTEVVGLRFAPDCIPLAVCTACTACTAICPPLHCDWACEPSSLVSCDVDV